MLSLLLRMLSLLLRMLSLLLRMLSLLLLVQKGNAIQNSCSFMPNAPIVEYEIPTQAHNLKFLNVDASVYRHTLSSGKQPKIKVLRYSSTPVFTINSTSNEILVSTEDSNCIVSSNPSSEENTAASIGESSSSNKLSIVTAAAASTLSAFALLLGHGSTTTLSAFVFLFGTTLFSNNFFFFTEATEIPCKPTIELVLEAPPYYLGSVSECLAEVKNKDHCPFPFPVFPTCGQNEYGGCQLAIVGAGTGGLYTALRLVDSNKIDGEDVCIFEATERVGGRLYSLRGFGPNKKITVDAGGYRTWPEYTPTTHALIEDYLDLKTGCYEDESFLEEPCRRFNIVDDDGSKIGFATLPETMMTRLIEAGACFFSRHELTNFEHNDDGSNTLFFANGAVVPNVQQVILNVPQRPLLNIIRKSNIPYGSESEEREMYNSAHSVQTEIVTKLYLYYDNVWWHKLGLFNGDFEMQGDAQNMLLQGRYHDGHVECDENGCHGFLLTVYSHDFGGNKAQYFRRYQRDRPEPVTIISNTDTEGAMFLKHAHDRLKEYHLYNVVNASYTGFQAQQVFDAADLPSFAVLATWNIGTYGAGGGWHHWTNLDEVEKAMKPLNDYNIHVVNEAFSKLQGWAEGSLLLADEILEDYFSVSRPWDFDAPDFVQQVAQTSSLECTLETGNSGGGSSGGSTGGGGSSGGNDDILCFTGDALVEMIDGTFKKISDVKKGDIVHTGFSGEEGVVTDVLVHEVFGPLQMGILSTPFGDLVGTLDHPIHFNGEWMEMIDAMTHERSSDSDMYFEGRISTVEVDLLYNLEVDGDAPGSSSHSYVVNNVIASGLGDNIYLNTLFPRQKAWKSVG